jgi:EamA domain-containing membrane protein RarD
MNQTIIIGTSIVTLALMCYSIAVITEQKKHQISSFILIFLTAGIISDITATVFMIVGSKNIPLTVHGVLGYSALTLMLIDTILIWNLKIKNNNTVSPKLHLYTRIAYLWWVTAYFAGGFIAIFRLY